MSRTTSLFPGSIFHSLVCEYKSSFGFSSYKIVLNSLLVAVSKYNAIVYESSTMVLLYRSIAANIKHLF